MTLTAVEAVAAVAVMGVSRRNDSTYYLQPSFLAVEIFLVQGLRKVLRLRVLLHCTIFEGEQKCVSVVQRDGLLEGSGLEDIFRRHFVRYEQRPSSQLM